MSLKGPAEKPAQPLSTIDQAYIDARRPKRKIKCCVCGQPEGSSGDGQPRRMVHLGDGKWACNYCNNQGPGR